MKFAPLVMMSLFSFLSGSAHAATELKVGDVAPGFSLKDDEGKDFSLDSRKGHWTVLYFYPKSETPGCTKQACAFRDSIGKIRALGAEVIGVSVNSVADQAEFKKNHHLNFPLLADDKTKVTDLYGSKMPILNMSKRWTFLLDPELKIQAIDHDVDPVKDADHVASKLKDLQAAAGKKS
ncbi:MAG TPA: peroxiredoxin [Bdellovibrionota bacterium]|jgi:peroxiredoxin Q/BCP|nr:peroxiredoxin [Bdellovibrionota bacterium]